MHLRGKRNASEILYRQAANRGNAEALAYLGSLEHKRGNFGEAERLYQLAIVAGDTHSSVNLAALLVQRKDYYQAEVQYRKAASTGDLLAVQHLARFLSKIESFEEAIILYEQLVRNPEFSSAQLWTEFGDLLDRAGRYQAAVLAYEEAFTIQESDPLSETLFGLAATLEHMERNDEAERIYSEFINSLDSDIACRAMVNLGVLWMRQDRLIESESSLKRAASLDSPHAFWGLHNLGVLYHKIGRLEDAENALRKATKAIDEDVVLSSNLTLAAVLMEGDHFVEVEGILDEVVTKGNPDQVGRAWAGLGEMFYLSERISESENAYKRVVELGNKDIVGLAWLRLGNIYEGRGHIDFARSALVKAVEYGSPDIAQAARDALLEIMIN
jgi:tetratricopeptide (TPR) repeat protein